MHVEHNPATRVCPGGDISDTNTDCFIHTFARIDGTNIHSQNIDFIITQHRVVCALSDTIVSVTFNIMCPHGLSFSLLSFPCVLIHF